MTPTRRARPLPAKPARAWPGRAHMEPAVRRREMVRATGMTAR